MKFVFLRYNIFLFYFEIIILYSEDLSLDFQLFCRQLATEFVIGIFVKSFVQSVKGLNRIGQIMN